jgi:ring-1,2-phenylacetyl-CoA epoxidase subunit PaaE
MQNEFHALTVAGVETLCEDAVAITFAVPDELAEDFTFRPGQSLTLRREIDGREQRRSYSICAPAGARPRVGVRVVPDGAFSTWLVHDVEAGDEIEVAPPAGRFTPDLSTPGHHVLLAAGSGITPVISIAASVLTNPESSVTLLYGNRRSSTVMFADELADLKDRYPERLELVHVLSREPQEVELFTGRLDAEKLQALLALLEDPEQVDHWWLCGPFDMVTEAQEVLTGHGVAAERIHKELFFVDDTPPTPARHPEHEIRGATSQATVIAGGRSSTVALPQDVVVLEGAQRFRPDLPFACKGGVCGTCRAMISDGKADMRRNFALEPGEVDAGFVLTCQSFPVSDELTVDYDA